MSSLPPVITATLAPLCTPAGVGQFVTGALTGQIPETQISAVCGAIVRACDGYVEGHPQRGPDISLKQAVQRFADRASRSEAAPEITGNAAAIANLVSAFLTASIDRGVPSREIDSGMIALEYTLTVPGRDEEDVLRNGPWYRRAWAAFLRFLGR